MMSLIPDDVTECFNRPNPSSCTMAFRLTQPLTVMSTRNLPGCIRWPAHWCITLTNSPPTISRPSIKVGVSWSHNHIGLHGLLQTNDFDLNTVIRQHHNVCEYGMVWKHNAINNTNIPYIMTHIYVLNSTKHGRCVNISGSICYRYCYVINEHRWGLNQ
jgi:hypothetical protein